MSKYEAVYECEFCKKDSAVSDELFEKIMLEDMSVVQLAQNNIWLCSCGQYGAKFNMKAKMLARTKDWKMAYASAN